MHTEIIFQHGWGFDAFCWSLMAKPLSAAGCTVHLAEAGYFGGTPVRPKFSQQQNYRIIVAHSLGLHLLAKDTLGCADALVLLSCFAAFHEGEAAQQKRSRRLVGAMLAKLPRDVAAVLADFQQRCYFPHKPDVSWMLERQANTAALCRDLQVLDREDFDASVLCGKIVHVVHGNLDGIVPSAAAERLHDLACLAGAQATLQRFGDAGHALPFTHLQPCLKLISSLVKAGSARKNEALPLSAAIR